MRANNSISGRRFAPPLMLSVSQTENRRGDVLETLIGLLPALSDLLKDTSRRRRLQDERGQRAVESILRAVNETKLYLAAQSRGVARDATREDNLSRDWVETAAALRGIDDDLAQRCRLKADYWADPDSWSEAELGTARILLTQVSADADALLGWTGPGARHAG